MLRAPYPGGLRLPFPRRAAEADEPVPGADDGASAWREPARERGNGRPWPERLGRLSLVLSGLLVPLLVAELLLRSVGAVVPGEYQTADLNTPSEPFGRLNMVNQSGWKRSREFSVHVRVNSKGLRGPEIPYAKPDGTERVLVIGDSFTFGAQVEEDETFVARLGHHLRQETADVGDAPAAIETINGGVDGWNTFNELAWLKAEGVKYAPDIVVLMFYAGNDPGENFDWFKAVKRSQPEVAAVQDSALRDVRRELARVSALVTFMEFGIIAKLSGAPEQPDPASLSALTTRRSIDADRKARGWEISADQLRQMRELCDERGVRLVVVGIPTLEHVAYIDREPTPIRAFAEQTGAQVIDLLDLLRAAPADSEHPLYFPRDRHWTPLAHDLAAEYVAGQLLDDGLVMASARPR
jgi:hypothetical protein